ncbi:hypothetical protein NS319_15580 [Sphingomonas sanguinis]|uniref:Uncharacterized protein n=1 Tax=Sphingomonas sanguinis TaxID=33051 RepID=A0A147HT78_9SPHN|nr:hypothetical protein NS319_15580 [Sphingomonas sanguinis]
MRAECVIIIQGMSLKEEAPPHGQLAATNVHKPFQRAAWHIGFAVERFVGEPYITGLLGRYRGSGKTQSARITLPDLIAHTIK